MQIFLAMHVQNWHLDMIYRLRPLHYHTKNRHSKKKLPEQQGFKALDEIQGVVQNLKSRLDFLTSEVERLTKKL